MPAKIASSLLERSRAIRVLRSSSFTRRVRSFSSVKGLRRNSPRVRGRFIAEKLQRPTRPGVLGNRSSAAELFRLYAPPFALFHVAVSAGPLLGMRVAVQHR